MNKNVKLKNKEKMIKKIKKRLKIWKKTKKSMKSLSSKCKNKSLPTNQFQIKNSTNQINLKNLCNLHKTNLPIYKLNFKKLKR